MSERLDYRSTRTMRLTRALVRAVDRSSQSPGRGRLTLLLCVLIVHLKLEWIAGFVPGLFDERDCEMAELTTVDRNRSAAATRIEVRRAGQRFQTRTDWLNSFHS